MHPSHRRTPQIEFLISAAMCAGVYIVSTTVPSLPSETSRSKMNVSRPSPARTWSLSCMHGDQSSPGSACAARLAPTTGKRRFQTGPRPHGATPVPFANDGLKWREK